MDSHYAIGGLQTPVLIVVRGHITRDQIWASNLRRFERDWIGSREGLKFGYIASRTLS